MLCIVTSACTSSASPNAQPRSSNSLSHPKGATGEIVPSIINLLLPDAHTQKLILRHIEKADDYTAKCMAKAGFKYIGPAPEYELSKIPGQDGGLLARRTIGWGAKSTAQTQLQFDDYMRHLTSVDLKRHGSALYGDQTKDQEFRIHGLVMTYPTSGCIAAGNAHGYGSYRAYAEVKITPIPYRNEAADLVNKDSRYNAAMERWPGCMKSGYGISAKSPSALSDSYVFGHSKHSITETSAAVADAICAKKVGILRAVLRVYESYIGHLDASDREALQRAAKTMVGLE